jgi:hypothetical protein
MNRTFKVTLLFALFCFAPAAATAQTGIPNTRWYTENPAAAVFTISTPDELAGLAQIVNGTWGGSPAYFNFDNRTINLANDIDLSDYGSSYNNGAGWTPIGISNIYSSGSFNGTFDGNGNIITGLYINRNTNYSGLFGYIMGSASVTAVKNLVIEDANINSAADRAGAVAGHISLGSVINCHVTGGSVTGNNNTGGLAGFINGGSIINCCSAASVTGSDNAGGVIGHVNGSSGSVTNCYSTGSVKGNNSVGGIAGYVINGGSVTHCYSTGSVSGNNRVGGLVGNLNDAGTVKNCAALNSGITAAASGLSGRIAGAVSTNCALINNAAWSGMITDGKTILYKGDSAADGEDITTLQINADCSIGGRFVNNNNPWVTENGKLPGFEMPVFMPEHLIEPVTSVISGNRNIPNNKPNLEPSDTASENMFSGELSYGDINKFTAGPNPAVIHSGIVNFFWHGAPLKNGTLFIYDACGNYVKTIIIDDKSGKRNAGKRNVGKWDLTNSKGRRVSAGAYVIKGKMIAVNGNNKRISLVIGVR